ncbi:MAG TPA: hypothetical protein VEI82_05055 [Myxococcota bacterium]|nr:hypothetical protein [Myxococcota bacterium]
MDSLETHAGSPRRVFLQWHEVTGLVLGVARGDAAACRRVLGARRGGRVGLVLALAALALAAPSPSAALGAAALHVALGLLLGLANRRSGGHTTKEMQRLALWAVLTPAGVAALVRPLAAGSALPLLCAVLLGQLLLWRALAATR